MSDPEVQSRLDFMGLGSDQRRTLEAMQPMVKEKLGAALDRFYTTARATPEIRSMFRDDAHMAKAKAMQETHWMRIANGQFDSEFHSSVRRIGAVHARIGLEPRYYIGAYALVLEELLRAIGNRSTGFKGLLGQRNGPSNTDASIAIVKAALMDMELSVSMYLEAAQAERDKANAKIAEGEKTLDDLLQWIQGTAESLQTGSGEIAQAADDLARRTESNAASLEETSAALLQIDGRVKATTTAAVTTVSRANDATTTVQSGRATAEVAVQTMERVSISAKGIDSVIEGVDKIAFQTRVLAMNAAIEAGRAGEAGRGFAVVADLVNALAMRAEEEAKRARDQLTVTQAEIVSAVDAVEKVDVALSAIADDVQAVNGLLTGIAADNQAQSGALSEITAAVSSMDRATQQNAAMVEETSAASRQLSTEINTLAARAAEFQAGRTKTPPPAKMSTPVRSLSVAA
jgi:methyl-accepting chemotaxis protein